DDWWSNLTQLKTYYNSFSRQETNLNRYGVTLIPPEYLSKFASTITLHTSPKFQTLCDKELKALLTLLNQAIEEGKFIIHYGI
ncbi:hypothetical protein LJB89_01455, partial [Tyzzerella sp. OttesenSCG-928-J15]|nr:hypothetical protein [Tyzzerella sp. OttesenSCG-928-J15]